MPAWGTQNGWHWCNKCHGLFFSSVFVNNEAGVCPAGGAHNRTNSGNYSLVHQATPVPANHQEHWRYCNKCFGLWFGEHQLASNCPAGGTHSQTGSGNYALAHNAGTGQTNWRWCLKCEALFFAGNPASRCPTGGEHDPSQSGNYHLPQVNHKVNVHTKTLTAPTVPITTMFQQMREVYGSIGIDVQWAGEETLDLPTLDVVDVGTCSGTPTAEQNSLFGNRNNAFASDVVIYFVLATNPAFNGCATHPSDKPGAVVAQIASQWTMAHEIGHVLGLSHITGENAPSCTTPDFTRLMTGCGTSNITVALPKLVAGEQTTMDASPYAHTLAN